MKEGCNIGIRIQHGDVSDFAKMGHLAGRAQASVRREQQEFQLTSQMMQQQAAEDRQRIALQSQRESQEFSAFMQVEANKRSQAWEFEKIEMSARNRFELGEQSFAMEFQAAEAARIQRQQEKEQKINSLRKAVATRQISQEEADTAILGLELGVPPSKFEMFRPEKEGDPYKQAVREALGGEVAETPSRARGPEAYEVTDVASQLMTLRSAQDPDTQRQIDFLTNERNLSKMKAALRKLSLGTDIAKPVAKPTKLPPSVNERVSNLPKTQQKVVKKALLEGSQEEQQAAMNALNLVERQKIEADRRKTEIEKNQELAKQREADRKMRKELGVQTVYDRMVEMPSMSLARPVSRRPTKSTDERRKMDMSRYRF